MSKVMGIYVKFWHFLHACSPNMAMSRDPRSKFQKILIFPNSAFNIRNVTKFLAEKLSTSEVISQKPHGRGWKPPPPPSAFRVKSLSSKKYSGLNFIRLSIFKIPLYKTVTGQNNSLIWEVSH